MKMLHIMRFVVVSWLLVLMGCVPRPPAKLSYAGLPSVQPGATTKTPRGGPWQWYDASLMAVEGKGWTNTESSFHRLPAKARNMVSRNILWEIGRQSAGISVRFVTAADRIAARWKLTTDELQKAHMAATGVSGLDLYVKQAGRWQWTGLGRPTTFPTNQSILASGLPGELHEYLLYLPLFNGVESLEVGLPAGAEMRFAPPRSPDKAKPICFYGTSIVHGGCASRPGMTYPAILGRRLDRPVINLGFGGNGKMDPELAELLGELEVASYVIDCLPNMTSNLVAQRVEPFVETLRQHRPDTPIVLVENIIYQASPVISQRRASYQDKNAALRKAYQNLRAKKIPNLHLVPCNSLLGSDGDATVDGTHPTDLGFYRYADALEPVLRKICAATVSR